MIAESVLQPTIPRLGSIKAGRKGATRKGGKGTYQLPEKLDHFIITTMQRGSDGNFIPNQGLMNSIIKSDNAIIRDKTKIIGLPIRLMYDDIERNFPTRLAAYEGKKCVCSGNGQEATRMDGVAVQCPCDWYYSTPKKCKPNGTLVCLVDGADFVGGCYHFKTTSVNTISSIHGSLQMIQGLTENMLQIPGGKLAGLPLHLILQPKTVAIPNSNKTTTVYVASVIYRGTIEALYRHVLEEIETVTRYRQSISYASKGNANNVKAIEFHHDFAAEADSDQDIAEEFYPEQTAKKATSPHPNEADGGNVIDLPVKSVNDLKQPPEKNSSQQAKAEVATEKPEETQPPSNADTSEISVMHGFNIGDTALYSFGQGIGEKQVEVLAFPGNDQVEIKILEETILDGTDYCGKTGTKPIGDLIPIQQTAELPTAEPNADTTPESSTDNAIQPLKRSEFINMRSGFNDEYILSVRDRLDVSPDAIKEEFWNKAKRIFEPGYVYPWLRTESTTESAPDEAPQQQEQAAQQPQQQADETRTPFDDSNAASTGSQAEQQQPEEPRTFTEQPTDRIGDDPERKAIKRIHAQRGERGLDADGVKIAMKQYLYHPKGGVPVHPFDVESTKDIQLQYVSLWEDMLDRLQPNHQLFMAIKGDEERHPGWNIHLREILANMKPTSVNPEAHIYQLSGQTVNKINLNYSDWLNGYVKLSFDKERQHGRRNTAG